MRDLPEPTTPRTPPKVARKRIPWSPEQEQTLIAGVQDGHSWGDISSKLERRNNQDVSAVMAACLLPNLKNSSGQLIWLLRMNLKSDLFRAMSI